MWFKHHSKGVKKELSTRWKVCKRFTDKYRCCAVRCIPNMTLERATWGRHQYISFAYPREHAYALAAAMHASTYAIHSALGSPHHWFDLKRRGLAFEPSGAPSTSSKRDQMSFPLTVISNGFFSSYAYNYIIIKVRATRRGGTVSCLHSKPERDGERSTTSRQPQTRKPVEARNQHNIVYTTS